MSELPVELKYAPSHEWARLDSDGTVVIGITEHAQEALGDVVYVELPEVGTEVDAGAEIAVIESVKAASDIYSPVTGKSLRLIHRWKMSRRLSIILPMQMVGFLG